MGFDNAADQVADCLGSALIGLCRSHGIEVRRQLMSIEIVSRTIRNLTATQVHPPFGCERC
jgi:hypothetical protein